MPWLDGISHATSRVPFDLDDRGLLLGDGVFDTSLVLAGTMVWRAAHVDRLLAACATLGFTVERARIEAAIDASLAGGTHGALRITVTRGNGPRGLPPPAQAKPVIFATLAPLRASALFAPVKLHPTSIRRNDTSPTARLKTLNYLDAILAMREALAAGCDDALFRNTRERLACTAIGNVFVLVGDQLVTPALAEGVLPGVTRAQVLAAAPDVGLEPIERPVTDVDLDRCIAVLVTNSLRLVAPVSVLGRREINSSASRRTQALVAHLAEIIREATGIDPRRLAEG